MMYFGYSLAVSLIAIVIFFLSVIFILPAVQTLSLATMIIYISYKAERLNEFQWREFPKWLKYHYKCFFGGGSFTCTYGVEQTDIQGTWTGVFKWKVHTGDSNDKK